jgi:hypothetical protein
VKIDDARTVLGKLRDYETSIQGIRVLFGDERRVSPADMTKARELMRTLKARIEEDSHPMRTVRGRANLNPVEDRYLRPAIVDISAAIKVSWNSTPDHRWISALVEADSDVRHWIGHLQTAMTEAGGG